MNLLDIVKEISIAGEGVYSQSYKSSPQRDILLTQDDDGTISFWAVTDGDPELAIDYLVQDVMGDWVEKQEDTPLEYLYSLPHLGVAESQYMLVKEQDLTDSLVTLFA